MDDKMKTPKLETLKKIEYSPSNKANITKKAISWYINIFRETMPSKGPANLKNGNKIHKKLPNTPLKVKAIIKTITIPAKDIISLIAPCFQPTIANIISNRIIPISNTFIRPLLIYYTFIIN